ncbi:MAG TPA: glycosyltransferase family 39 protein [Tepidisphaeraceae bacterium]|jgi:hypothetical protein|nr:glycosyltransferase family 39 protein [Tepidisphaeraceae bacterium]
MNSLRNRLPIALFCLVMLLGAGLRLQRFLLRAPFWGDEAFVVLNVRDLPARRMLGPLRYDQAAPPGFLLLQKAMARAFGTGELSMRAIPLICGLAAMGIVAWLAWRLFGWPAAIFAGGLMALCQNLIEYSAEVKQYSGDACAAAILLAVALGWEGSPLRRLWRSAIAAAILVWFSHPAAIVFGGISAVLSIGAWRDLFGNGFRTLPGLGHSPSPFQAEGRGEGPEGRDAQEPFGNSTRSDPLPSPPPGRGREKDAAARFLKPLLKAPAKVAGVLAANALFAGSFLLLYRYSIRFEHTNFLYSFWGDSFPDWSRPGTLLPWLIRQTSQWINEPYHGAGWVLAALAVLSVRRWTKPWLMVAAALGLTVIAACLRQYPYGGSRLTLFTLPGFFLLAAAGGELIRQWMPSRWRGPWWILPGAVLGYGLAWGILRAAEPPYRSYLRPAIAYLETHRNPDEPIYCLGDPQLNKPRRIFVGRHVEILCYWPNVPGKVETEVRSLDQIGGDRFWVLVPFNVQDGVPTLNKALKLLAPIATPMEKYVDPRGGAAILYRRHFSKHE